MGIFSAGCAEALFGYEMFRSTTSGLHVVAVAVTFWRVAVVGILGVCLLQVVHPVQA